jgi:hypothetical protein
MTVIKTLIVGLTACLIVGFSSCSNYLDKPRPIFVRCTGAKAIFLRDAQGIFERNGYTVQSVDTVAGKLVAFDSVENVRYRYTSLVRTWTLSYVTRDSVRIDVESLSTRLDDSDVRQTWDKRWAGEDVREWMRPVLISLETSCGLGNPLTPR